MGSDATTSLISAQTASIFPDGGAADAFAAAYAGDIPAADIPATSRRLAAHLRVGRVRPTGVDLVEVVPPEPGQPEQGGVTVAVVTDDRPFLVDTVTARIAEQGWTLRQVWHPILTVARDADASVLGLAAEGTTESWLSVEAHPPLGTSAAERTPDLLAALREGLAASRAVDEDAAALRVAAL